MTESAETGGIETRIPGYVVGARNIVGSSVVATVALTGLAIVTQAPPVDAANKVNAKKLLKKLPVKSEKNRGYSRAKFRHWIEADRDGCDTREKVLIAESKNRVRTGSGGRVPKGKWVSVYDGKRTRNSSKFDVDHRYRWLSRGDLGRSPGTQVLASASPTT